MGKLCDLVKFKNYLTDNLDKFDLHSSIENTIGSINKIKKIFPTYSDYIDNTVDEYLKLNAQNKKIIANIIDKISQTDQEIDSVADFLFDNDEYRDFFSELHLTNSTIENNLVISIETQSWIESKVTQYSDWHYPALQINPRLKKWIDPMVAGDPLYLSHTDISVVKELIQGYPELYQNRLRLYEIVDRNFSVLPQGQFGFVFCWDNFNYLSLDKIEKYIREVWLLLRPGGHFIFSYNNCDLEGPAYRTECRRSSYASARILTKLFHEIGYELIELCDIKTDDGFNTHVSWADIKKPGVLSTNKAHQASARVLPK